MIENNKKIFNQRKRVDKNLKVKGKVFIGINNRMNFDTF